MALSTSNRSTTHFLTRLTGLTGLAVGLVGLVWWHVTGEEAGWILALVGAGLAVIGLLGELKAASGLLTSRRGAVGSNVALQVVLAAVLLAGVNYFSFFHFQRFDWTHDGEFTIPPAVRQQLADLRGDTTLVVYQRHTAFGQAADKQDNYDSAAARKIVEKVKDLVEQFQQLGPRFHVEMLDIQEDNFQDKLTKLRQESPDLAKAIDQAPEDSLFFASDGKIQRLSFHDVYQLDKKASQLANDKKGNLILNYQGVDPFSRKILNIEQKRPRIALGTVHEVLSLESTSDEWGMKGAKKALEARGFDTRDILLKKWSDMAPPEGAVLTFDESKFGELEEQVTELDAIIKVRREDLREINEQKAFWKDSTLEEINKDFGVVDVGGELDVVERPRIEKAKKAGQKLRVFPVEEDHRQQILSSLERNLAVQELNLKTELSERETLAKEKAGLNVEELAERRRIADLKAKLSRLLADADLLILPRITLLNAPRKEGVPNRAHRLEETQVEAIKDFMKAGKPVLFCLGPTNEDQPRFDPTDPGPDAIEAALAELGFKLPKQTILFNVESKSFGERRAGLVILGTQVEVPPVDFDWEPGAGLPKKVIGGKLTPNPIRTSLNLSTRSVSPNKDLELRLRHPRPVYFEGKPGSKKASDPTILMASTDSWNENNPFPSRERTPRFERPKGDDPNQGKVEEVRRGPFPIGAAIETTLPSSWYGDAKEPKMENVRVAVIGQGGAFTGSNLSPVKEKLLLDTCNWLLGRDDLLARDNQTWQYPRVALSENQLALWQWGTRLGLPLLFVYLGLVVWLVRRMR